MGGIVVAAEAERFVLLEPLAQRRAGGDRAPPSASSARQTATGRCRAGTPCRRRRGRSGHGARPPRRSRRSARNRCCQQDRAWPSRGASGSCRRRIRPGSARPPGPPCRTAAWLWRIALAVAEADEGGDVRSARLSRNFLIASRAVRAEILGLAAAPPASAGHGSSSPSAWGAWPGAPRHRPGAKQASWSAREQRGRVSVGGRGRPGGDDQQASGERQE